MARTRYILFRCNSCKRLLTALEVERAWELAESLGMETKGICPCGSGRISPTNATPEEQEELGSEEQHERYKTGLRDHKTRLWEVYYERVLTGDYDGRAYGEDIAVGSGDESKKD